MKILQVVKWLSSKDDTGGRIRSTRLGKALSSFAEVDVAGFSIHVGPCNGNKNHLSHYGAMYPLHIDNLPRQSIKILTGWTGGLSLRSARFFDPVCRRFLENIFKENRYDAIQVEELPLMSQLTGFPSEAPVIYSAHNVESQLSPMMFRHQNPVLRLLAGMERARTAREEKNAIVRSDACIAVSEKDRDTLRKLDPQGETPIYVLPNCADDRFTPSAEPVSKKEILFLGSFQWRPNAHGILWFMDEILPLLKRRDPHCLVRIVGSGISRSLYRKFMNRGLRVHGDVPDVLPYLQNARLLFVPLKIGGGTRIKIMEAWASGLPVVSTTTGADGLEYRQGVDILTADDPKEFAHSIHRILESHNLYLKLRSQGLINSKDLRWSGLSGRLEEIYTSI